jgi:hypothetical protein
MIKSAVKYMVSKVADPILKSVGLLAVFTIGSLMWGHTPSYVTTVREKGVEAVAATKAKFAEVKVKVSEMLTPEPEPELLVVAENETYIGFLDIRSPTRGHIWARRDQIEKVIPSGSKIIPGETKCFFEQVYGKEAFDASNAARERGKLTKATATPSPATTPEEHEEFLDRTLAEMRLKYPAGTYTVGKTSRTSSLSEDEQAAVDVGKGALHLGYRVATSKYTLEGFLLLIVGLIYRRRVAIVAFCFGKVMGRLGGTFTRSDGGWFWERTKATKDESLSDTDQMCPLYVIYRQNRERQYYATYEDFAEAIRRSGNIVPDRNVTSYFEQGKPGEPLVSAVPANSPGQGWISTDAAVREAVVLTSKPNGMSNAQWKRLMTSNGKRA